MKAGHMSRLVVLLLVDPQARLVVVFMVQMLPNRTEYGQLFPTLVYQALLDSPRVRQ